MTDTEIQLREEIIYACNKMNNLGINQGTSGNISTVFNDGILISPSATPYDRMSTDDIVYVNNDGTHNEGKIPSTEWRFHLAISNSSPDIAAVVHTHSIYASICSIRREEIPAVHYMIAASGGSSIKCSDYATYGTQELADAAVAAIKGRNACLLANHGVIATGSTIEKALWLAKEVEVLAQQFIFSRLLGGSGPVILANDEIKRVKDKFTEYGIRS